MKSRGSPYGAARALLLVAAAALPVASGAVIGIDLGARFLKVGIIQPGVGIELVLNEATQRKSSSAAGFNTMDERVYGNEAQNLLGKVPGQVFVMSKLLLGQPLDSQAIADFKTYLHPYNFEEDEATKAAIMRYSANSTYRPEEMVAFVLSYAKQIAEGHANAAVKDCVITIPPFFGHLERRALMNAATIAGLNVLSLIHESTAFGFKYGFDKESEFGTEPTNVVFYDLGASSYKVSVVAFSSVVGKKNKTQGSMTVKGLGWDSSLGGKDFDQIVLNMLAAEFNEKQLKGKSDCRDFPKAVGKLRKAAESTKDILSANTKYQVGIEALHDDRDMRMVVSREEFTKTAGEKGLWARLLPPLEQALAAANLTKADIHRVEVVGGATRIPQVKQAAMDFFGRKQLDGALNGDEAAALGATLYAAKLSTSFRLREFTITDAYPYATSIAISGQSDAGADEGEEGGAAGGSKGKDKLLFKANTKMPHKKLISMTRVDDLIATLSTGEPDGPLVPIGSFNVSGVAAAYARMQKDEKRTILGKPKVSVTFTLSSSGLIDVSKAEMALEMLEQYEDFEYVPANATDDDNATAADGADAEAKGDDEAGSSNSSNSSGGNSSVPMVKVKVEKERKRMHYTTLKVARTVLGAATPISADVVAECIQRNAELLKAEQKRKTNAEAKNALESFIIDTRDKMSDEAMEQVSTEEEREAARGQFDEMEDWIYGDGASLEAPVYHKKRARAEPITQRPPLPVCTPCARRTTEIAARCGCAAAGKELVELTSPIFTRHAELEARPKAVAQAREAVNWTQTILETWATERPEVTAEEREKVGGMCANFTEWLDGVEAAQAELPLTATPAFLSTAVPAKLEPIEIEARDSATH